MHFNELKIFPHKDIELMKLHHTVPWRRFSTMSGKDPIKLFLNACILSICVPFLLSLLSLEMTRIRAVALFTTICLINESLQKS